MKELTTPIIIKADDSPLPQDIPIFYLLTRDGLFRCRNHRFFTSSVKMKDEFPRELAGHKASLTFRYPRIPKKLMETVVGFFSIIGKRHQSEAAALFVWNNNTNEVEVIIPKQTGIVGASSFHAGHYPMEVKYEIPILPPHQVLIGDIHSHVNMSAYSSMTDQDDEKHGAGLHIIVGEINREPPQFHCDVTVDGARFRVSLKDISDYKRRARNREVPLHWFDQFKVEIYKPTTYKWDDRPCVPYRGKYLDDEYADGYKPFRPPLPPLPLP